MKTLYLIRHAKSSWEFDIDDHKRPLTKRGYTDAECIGNDLKQRNLQVDAVITSDALRATITAEIVTDIMGIQNLIVRNAQVYDFSGEQVLQVLRTTDSAISRMILFGHNNALTSLANQLGSRVIDHVPTAGVVALRFDTRSWYEIDQQEVERETLFTVYPKNIR